MWWSHIRHASFLVDTGSLWKCIGSSLVGARHHAAARPDQDTDQCRIGALAGRSRMCGWPNKVSSTQLSHVPHSLCLTWVGTEYSPLSSVHDRGTFATWYQNIDECRIVEFGRRWRMWHDTVVEPGGCSVVSVFSECLMSCNFGLSLKRRDCM